MSDSTLNQCLFCTSKPEPHPQSVGYGAAAAFAIWCQKCGALGPECKTPEEAIQRWNNAQAQDFKKCQLAFERHFPHLNFHSETGRGYGSKVTNRIWTGWKAAWEAKTQQAREIVDLWQPIETIPTDETVTVYLKNAKGEIDTGNWYWFTDKKGVEGEIASLHGYGDYTYWKPYK